MNITVNGQATELAQGDSIAALIDRLLLGGRRLAVEINGELVPRSAHLSTVLQDGDRVEIVHAIGGG